MNREHPLHLNVDSLVAAGGLLLAMLPSAVFWWHVMLNGAKRPTAGRDSSLLHRRLGKIRARQLLLWYCEPGSFGDQALAAP